MERDVDHQNMQRAAVNERVVVLHYHLFKNAGTSVDHILQANFAGKWVTAEFPRLPGPMGNTDLVTQWILDNPNAIAFSTHTAMGPIPKIPGTRIISIVFLRDPIERIKSAYQFERKQAANTYGARLAKEHNFEGYVLARLALDNDRQCRNFQTERLSRMVQCTGTEIERAYSAVTAVSVVGIVSEFDTYIEVISDHIREYFPDFRIQSVHANSSKSTHEMTKVTSEITEKLSLNNSDDYQLLSFALGYNRCKWRL